MLNLDELSRLVYQTANGKKRVVSQTWFITWYVGLTWCCISLFNIDFNTSLREKSQTCLKGNIFVQIMGTPSSHQSLHKMDDSCPYRDENTSYNYVLHTSLLQFLGHSFNHFKSHNINHVSRVMLRFSFVIHMLPGYLKTLFVNIRL